MSIRDVDRGIIEDAMRRFDAGVRETSEWQDWERNLNHRYAIQQDTRLYPVKQIIRMATGDANAFSGGVESNSYLQAKGFDIVSLGGRGEATVRPSFWIEKTIVRGHPDRESGPYALGQVLWSPQRAKGGQDIYRFMRDVKDGDLVMHLTDNEAFTGISQVASAARDFDGVAGTEWDKGLSYLVSLRDFQKLEPPLSRNIFFESPFKERLVSLLEAGGKYMFFNKEPSLNQGAYLTPAPPELVTILNDAYERIAGRPLPLQITEVSPEPTKPESQRSGEMDQLLQSIESQGLYFSEELIANYLLALETKRFVILSGLSGTGKTQLAIAVARQFPVSQTSKRPGLVENCCVVAVRPDWTDGRGLLGYFNPLIKHYVIEPALQLLMRAATEVSSAARDGRRPLPFFLILDEMNLAHVEQYFSDFLSCLESGEKMDLHREVDLETEANKEEVPVPQKLAIPPNVFFTGTVNVDETTYMFSPKVLDRAFTIELHSVDLAGYGESSASLQNRPGALRLRNLPELDRPKKPDVVDWEEFSALEGGQLRGTVVALNDLLAPYNLHFGYRVANEIARFVLLTSRHGDRTTQNLWAALDIAILEKVLPKFHGTQEELDEPLRAMFMFAGSGAVAAIASSSSEAIRNGWCLRYDRLEPTESGPTELRLPRTATKIWLMMRRLHQQGFTAFIS